MPAQEPALSDPLQQPPAPQTPAQVAQAQNTVQTLTNNRLFAGVVLAVGSGLLASVGAFLLAWLNLSSQLQTLTHQQQSTQATLDTLRTEKATLSTEVERHSINTQVLINKINDHMAEITALRSKIENAQQQIAKCETAITSDSSKLLTVENNLEVAKSNIAEILLELGKVQGYIDAKKETGK